MGQDGEDRQGGHDGGHREGEQDRQSDEDVHDLLTHAHALMRWCKYEEALPLTQWAVKLAPQSVKAWQELGSNFGYLGRVADLERAFEQALLLAVTPEEECETWYYRGHAENNASAWEAAMHSFQRLAELEPDWGGPYLMQGMVLENMGAFIDKHYFADVLVATDRALLFGGLCSVDERVVYQLKASALVALGRREEAGYYQRKAEELIRVEQAEREAHQPGPAGTPGTARIH